MRSFPEVVRGGWYWNILRGRVISVMLFIVICLCFVAHESHCFQGICVNTQALCVSRKADTTITFTPDISGPYVLCCSYSALFLLRWSICRQHVKNANELVSSIY